MRLRPRPEVQRKPAATGSAWPRRASALRGLRTGLLRLCVLLGLALAVPSPNAAKVCVRYITGNGIRYLYLVDVASYYGLRFESSSQRFSLRSRYTSLSFTVDETEALVNGTRVHLSDAPWIAKGYAVVADVDFRLLLSPILNAASLRRGDVRRVLIDPGHGGKDPGTRGRRSREKDITLQVARRLERELTAKGYTVALTRTRDVDVSLGARSEKARAWKADISVSLHCNAAGPGVQGIEVFRVPPEGARSTYGLQRASTASPGNAWDGDNARLAYEVQRAAVAATGATDRGMKNARFAVIRECPCPAILVEMGFMSYPAEESSLGNADYQDKLARGIAAGISRYDACLPPR